MNDVGEPCAGEPHARFERGPLAKQPLSRCDGTQAPHGKPTGLSPSTYQSTDQPAAYLTKERREVPRDLNVRGLVGQALPPSVMSALLTPLMGRGSTR